MAVGDTYEVVMGGFHPLGQVFRTVFFYEQTEAGSPVADASVLASNFDTDILAYMRDVMVQDWTINFREVKNLDNEDDYEFEFAPAAGLLVGNSPPPVLAIGFRSPRQAPGVHRGRHNLPLGKNTWIATYGYIDDTAFDTLYFLQQQLGLPIVDGVDGGEWEPVLVQKHYTGGVLTGYTKRASLVGQWQISRIYTTQKTRQGFEWTLADEPA